VGHHPVPGKRAVAGDDRLGDLGMRRVDVVGREPVAVEDRLIAGWGQLYPVSSASPAAAIRPTSAPMSPNC
jgi:hypothetical protein